MIVLLLTVGFFAGVIGLIVFTVKRELGIVQMLQREGITVEVPIEDFSVSYSHNNSDDSSESTYYIHYTCNGVREKSKVSYDEYRTLQFGQIIPITYGQGHVRYNIYKQQFPVIFAPGYENQQHAKKEGIGLMQGFIDNLFGDNNVTHRNHSVREHNDYNRKSEPGFIINIEDGKNDQGNNRKHFQ